MTITIPIVDLIISIPDKDCTISDGPRLFVFVAEYNEIIEVR